MLSDDFPHAVQHVRRGLVLGPAEVELVDRVDPEALELSECNLPAAGVEQEDKYIAVSPVLIDPHIERPLRHSLSEVVQRLHVDVQLLSRQGVAPRVPPLKDVGSRVLGGHHVAVDILGGDLLAHEVGLALAGKFGVVVLGVALVDHILGLVAVDRVLQF